MLPEVTFQIRNTFGLKFVFSVYGHWTKWEEWSTCKVFPIDRTRKFSTRTRTCECNNCNNYCVGKDLERKICSCADGYIMGENEWLPCIKKPTLDGPCSRGSCNKGELCNMNKGKSGGFCELCPGKTDRDCIVRAFSNGFGFAECRSVCVTASSKFIIKDFFTFKELLR